MKNVKNIGKREKNVNIMKNAKRNISEVFRKFLSEFLSEFLSDSDILLGKTAKSFLLVFEKKSLTKNGKKMEEMEEFTIK